MADGPIFGRAVLFRVSNVHDDAEEVAMGMFGKAIKSGVAIKAIQVVKREASKPENQRKAKEMLAKLRDKRG